MLTHNDIHTLLHSTPIQHVQWDLNGVCNVGCWFCPVRYEQSPERQNTAIDDVQRILDMMITYRANGTLISPNFTHIYTGHYNEILLYPHFETFLQFLAERRLSTTILTNGTTLLPRITDILKRYEHVIAGINFNIPAIERDEWKKQVKNSDILYDRLMENLTYVFAAFPERVRNKTVYIGMNGITERSLYSQGGWVELGVSCGIQPHTLSQQYMRMKEVFPDVHIYMNDGIVDRDRLLEKNDIFSLEQANTSYNKNVKQHIIGCRNGAYHPEDVRELYGRPFSWLHIDSLGYVFLCCQDFHLTTRFGNILTTPLEDIWFSQEHIDMIYDAFQGMCTHCVFGQWG